MEIYDDLLDRDFEEGFSSSSSLEEERPAPPPTCPCSGHRHRPANVCQHSGDGGPTRNGSAGEGRRGRAEGEGEGEGEREGNRGGALPREQGRG